MRMLRSVTYHLGPPVDWLPLECCGSVSHAGFWVCDRCGGALAECRDCGGVFTWHDVCGRDNASAGCHCEEPK